MLVARDSQPRASLEGRPPPSEARPLPGNSCTSDQSMQPCRTTPAPECAWGPEVSVVTASQPKCIPCPQQALFHERSPVSLLRRYPGVCFWRSQTVTTSPLTLLGPKAVQPIPSRHETRHLCHRLFCSLTWDRPRDAHQTCCSQLGCVLMPCWPMPGSG